MRSRGVVAVRPEVSRMLLVPEQRQQLETFAALTAMALERVHYVDVARSATVQMETERLRNSLLSALSHDLRTPLAVLAGMAETLATDLIGTGPKLQLDLGPDVDASAVRQVELANYDWSIAIDLPGKLRTMRKSRAIDG
jgi:two-component system sensor histidine kinase KdpD